MKKITVAIADDHSVVLEGVRAILSGHSYIELLGIFSNVNDLFSFLEENNVDVILLDIDIPVSHKLNTLQEIKKQFPSIHVIIYTMHEGAFYYEEAVKYGANAFMLKSDPVSHLPTVIIQVTKGIFYCSDKFKTDHKKNTVNTFLKPIELDIVNLLGQGLSYLEIGKKTGKSSKTIEYHTVKLKQKYKLKSNTELVLYIKDEYFK